MRRIIALALCSTALAATAARAETQQPNAPQIFTMSPMASICKPGPSSIARPTSRSAH